jgi:hypothetical protein
MASITKQAQTVTIRYRFEFRPDVVKVVPLADFRRHSSWLWREDYRGTEHYTRADGALVEVTFNK